MRLKDSWGVGKPAEIHLVISFPSIFFIEIEQKSYIDPGIMDLFGFPAFCVFSAAVL